MLVFYHNTTWNQYPEEDFKNTLKFCDVMISCYHKPAGQEETEVVTACYKFVQGRKMLILRWLICTV